MKKKFFEQFDYLLILCVLILVSTGIAFIYSSGINAEGVLVTNEYIKQIVWAGIGCVLMIGTTIFFDIYHFRHVLHILYIVSLGILCYTALFGRYVNGARSWIGIGKFGVQPSEFMKLIFIITLSRYLADSTEEHPVKRCALATGICVLPVGLILLQPDLGTASVYIPIFLIVCFMAKIPFPYLLYLLSLGIVTIVFTVLPIWNDTIARTSTAVIKVLTDSRLRLIVSVSSVTIAAIAIIIYRFLYRKKYYRWIASTFSIIALAIFLSFCAGKVLHDYQIQRLLVFLDPSTDPRGAGWHIIQSKIAIGSGGLWGRSFLQGTQSHYRFLPQQSTDFIFSILSEEWGFAGGLLVYTLYALILIRMLVIMWKTSDKFFLYIISGIFAMFFFHFFINIGMVIGIMPITGIPLLFLSYGGSSLWTAMVSIGLVMNISRK